MVEVSIHADVREYKEKLLLGLSLRKVACVAAAGAIGCGLSALLTGAFGMRVEDAAWPVMAVTVPLWLLGFWSPLDMEAERYLRLLVQHRFGDGTIAYMEPGERIEHAKGKGAEVIRRIRPGEERTHERAGK